MPVFRRRSDEKVEANGIERLGRSALVLLAPFLTAASVFSTEHRPQAHNITNQTSQRPSVSQLLIHHSEVMSRVRKQSDGIAKEAVGNLNNHEPCIEGDANRERFPEARRRANVSRPVGMSVMAVVVGSCPCPCP